MHVLRPTRMAWEAMELSASLVLLLLLLLAWRFGSYKTSVRTTALVRVRCSHGLLLLRVLSSEGTRRQ